jgi:hypothetical protein
MGNDGVSTVISLRLEGDTIVQRGNGATNANGLVQHKESEEIIQL